jgi:hypothetical protein
MVDTEIMDMVTKDTVDMAMVDTFLNLDYFLFIFYR